MFYFMNDLLTFHQVWMLLLKVQPSAPDIFSHRPTYPRLNISLLNTLAESLVKYAYLSHEPLSLGRRN